MGMTGGRYRELVAVGVNAGAAIVYSTQALDAYAAFSEA